MTALSTTALLAEFDQLPLMGAGLRRCVEILAKLASRVAAQSDPVLKRAILARGAELALQRGDDDALQQLVLAAELAEFAGDERETVRLRLLVVRGVARRQRTRVARRLLQDLEGAAEEHGLQTVLDLARVACELGDIRSMLERLLERLEAPLDHERVRTHIELAERLDRGGDLVEARNQLRAARRLARTHDDFVTEMHVVTLEANLCVYNGLHQDGFPLVRESVALSRHLGDTLTELSQGAVLCAMLMDRGLWPEVETLSGELEVVATERGNWLALVDARISRSTCALERGDLPGCVESLLDGADLLLDVGHGAGLNIIKARLAEVRNQVGSDTFGPALEALLQSRQGEHGTPNPGP